MLETFLFGLEIYNSSCVNGSTLAGISATVAWVQINLLGSYEVYGCRVGDTMLVDFFKFLLNCNIIFGRNIVSGISMIIMFLTTYIRVSDYYDEFYDSIYIANLWKLTASVFCPVFLYQTLDLSSIPAVIHFGGMETFWMICAYAVDPRTFASLVLTCTMVLVYFRKFFRPKRLFITYLFSLSWSLIWASIFGATWMQFFIFNPDKLLAFYIFCYIPTWALYAIFFRSIFRVDI